MSRARLWLVPLVALALTASVGAQSGSSLRQIGQLRLAILGLSAVPDPASPVVPRNTPSGVRVVVPCSFCLLFVDRPRSSPPSVGVAQAPVRADHAEVTQGQIAELVARLASKDERERQMAAQDLARLGPAARPATDALIRALKDEDQHVCLWAVRALFGLGPEASSSVVPPILQMVHDRSGEAGAVGVPICANEPFSDLEALGAAAVAPSIAAMGGPASDAAYGFLVTLGPSLALSGVTELLDHDARRAEEAAQVLSAWHADAGPAVPALRRAYQAGRIAAVPFLSTIASIGPGAQAAGADVAELVAAHERTLREHAIETLGAIRSPAGVPALMDVLASEGQHNDILKAIQALGQIGPPARAAIPALRRRAEGRDPTYAAAAREALRRIGG